MRERGEVRNEAGAASAVPEHCTLSLTERRGAVHVSTRSCAGPKDASDKRIDHTDTTEVLSVL